MADEQARGLVDRWIDKRSLEKRHARALQEIERLEARVQEMRNDPDHDRIIQENARLHERVQELEREVAAVRSDFGTTGTGL